MLQCLKKCYKIDDEKISTLDKVNEHFARPQNSYKKYESMDRKPIPLNKMKILKSPNDKKLINTSCLPGPNGDSKKISDIRPTSRKSIKSVSAPKVPSEEKQSQTENNQIPLNKVHTLYYFKPVENPVPKSVPYDVQKDTFYIYFIAKKIMEIDNSINTRYEILQMLFNQMSIRVTASIPKEIEIISLNQLYSLKSTIQSELLCYETHIGRPKTKFEKQISKPIYSMYRKIKERIYAETTELPNSPVN